MNARKSSSARREAPMSTSTNRAPSSAPTLTSTPLQPATSADLPADWWSDRYSILLLVLLYAAQGLPIGLAFGSVPFLLKESGASYAALAQFSMASLPYSLKLLIAPVVDALYVRSFGRRKSWIVPVQLVLSATILLLSGRIPVWVRESNVTYLTPTFFALLTMTATQDIAVDGWSLTMLQRNNVAYASTCQSLGLSLGYFSTFTIFLALSSAEFCNQYVRRIMPFLKGAGPVATLTGTLQLAGLFYLVLTLYIAFFKQETPDLDASKKSDEHENLAETREAGVEEASDASSNAEKDGEMHVVEQSKSAALSSILSTYSDLFVVTKLPAVRRLVAALLIAKVGFSAYDNVAALKLLEGGFAKETMASMAVIQTPFTIFGTILMGRWTAKVSPIKLYLYGFLLRFIISLSGPLCVAYLWRNGGVVTPTFYVLVLSLTILYSLASECLMFIGIGAFFLNISSSSVHLAGSYLTLLNTASNMGGIWHKAITLWLVSKLSIRETCVLPPDVPSGTECPLRHDGYYTISLFLIPVSCVVALHLFRTMPKLGKLPDSAWKVTKG